MKLQPYTLHNTDGKTETGMKFYCPACRDVHLFRLTGVGDLWKFNGNMTRPSFTPSLLLFTVKGKRIDGKWTADGRVTICHLYLTDGVIEYCNDNPHALNGQKIPLPDIPSNLKGG